MTTATTSAAPTAGFSYNPVSGGADAAKAPKNSTDPTVSQDRFLKLLVAQLNNQDPMNPMDNAQMTSQIAQINTVTGIQQLNTTMTSMASQFASLQVMQGGAMVGRDVLTEGSTLTTNPETQVASGSFDLSGTATNVTVQVLSPGGQVLENISVGALDKGRHNFEWDASKYSGAGAVSFRVVATNGADKIAATTLTRDKVVSVSSENNALVLQLSSGASVPYSAVKAVM